MHPSLLAAINLFNEEKFFEAHESMEEFWQQYDGADRVYYQALIQLTVALHLYKDSRFAGAQKVIARAEKNMQNYQGLISGIDLALLRNQVKEYCLSHGKLPKIEIT